MSPAPSTGQGTAEVAASGVVKQSSMAQESRALQCRELSMVSVGGMKRTF